MATDFGRWLKQRRKALDITQEALAGRIGCAAVTLYKIEAGERRPSRQIAELLAGQLNIPAVDTDQFVAFARRTDAVTEDAPWGTPFHPPTNLPPPLTSLIGRERDVEAIRKHLLRTDTQLLTLVGPPGIGKTSLAVACAHDVLDEFSDGVFIIWLAAVHDADLLAKTILLAVGIQESSPLPALERLKSALSDKSMLLVLDNFEQILAGSAQVAELLSACPFVKMLVTSRAPLRIRRERQFPVSPLELPDMNSLPALDELPGYTAVRLFVERAGAVQPDFALTAENASAVAAICHRLDGLPLAIELISARVKLLPPSALLEHLHGHLLLGGEGLRDLDPRHQTLNTAIGWSYDLLDAHEKAILRRLAVFAGGCTPEAARTVCQLDTLEGIASLIDKSLLQPKTGAKGEAHFILLETIREYALERLMESGEADETRRRHAQFFLAWAEATDTTSLDRLETEYDNLTAALGWCLNGDPALGLRLVLAACNFWLLRRQIADGCWWLERYITAVERSGIDAPDDLRTALDWLVTLAYFQGDMRATVRHAGALLAVARRQGDKASMARATFYLGIDTLIQGQYQRAQAIFEDALSLSREAEHPGHIASMLLMLGNVAYFQGDYDRAFALNSESMALYRQLGIEWGEALVFLNNGDIRVAQADYPAARALYIEALHISRRLDDRRTLSVALEHLANLVSLEYGDHHLAAQLMGAVAALRDSISAAIEPLDRLPHEERVARLRGSLGDRGFAAAWAEGRRWTMEQAVERALGVSTLPVDTNLAPSPSDG